jgi:hypothetical protein
MNRHFFDLYPSGRNQGHATTVIQGTGGGALTDPFDPPAPDLGVAEPPSDPGGPWRTHSEVVIPRWRTLAFPADRCVRCGGRPIRQVLLTFRWTPHDHVRLRWTPLAVLFGLGRWSADARVSLCQRHDTERIAATLAPLAGLVTILLCVIAARVTHEPWLLAPLAITCVATWVSTYIHPVLGVARMDDEFAWLTEVDLAIVDSLPEF